MFYRDGRFVRDTLAERILAGLNAQLRVLTARRNTYATYVQTERIVRELTEGDSDMPKDLTQSKHDVATSVKSSHGIRGRIAAFADGVIANLRTATSVEDLNLMLDEFEQDKAQAINDVIGNAKD